MTAKKCTDEIDPLKRTCSMSDVLSNRGDEELFSTASACGDEEIGSLLCRLFEEQRFTDVTFFSDGDKEKSLSAHRVVMASKSRFFEDLLYGEQRFLANGMQMQVQIKQVPFSVFKNLVRYFYTGSIEFPDDSCLLDIYAAAQSFKVQDLLEKCKIFIESIHLSEDNVCSFLQACNEKNVEGLRSRCIRFIQENTRQVFKSTGFEECAFTTIREICELDRLCLASESELLGVILRWTDVQPSHTKKDLTRALVKCIRFLDMSPKDFSDFIQKHTDILNPEEGLNILMHLTHPTSESLNSLPKWCRKSRRSLDVGPEGKVTVSKIPRCHYNVYSEARNRIQIPLKDSTRSQQFTELTSRLYLKCVKGEHFIKSIHFSFKDVKGDGKLLAFLLMKVQLSPGGLNFYKYYNVKTSESSFVFPRSIRVTRGQFLELKVSSKITPSCMLMQYTESEILEKDFQIFTSSKPQQGNLYCISGVEYETSKE